METVVAPVIGAFVLKALLGVILESKLKLWVKLDLFGAMEMTAALFEDRPNCDFTLRVELDIQENEEGRLSPCLAEGDGFRSPVERNARVTEVLAVAGLLVATNELRPRSKTRL